MCFAWLDLRHRKAPPASSCLLLKRIHALAAATPCWPGRRVPGRRCRGVCHGDVCVCVRSAGLLLGSSWGLTPAGGSAHDSQPGAGSVCWFAACQLPPVYLFNCFGCFFPLPLGVCLPRLSTGSPRRRVPGTASLPEPALCPPNVRLGQTCVGRAEPPCAGIAGGGPACPSGVSAPRVPKPEATAEPAPGRATASTRTLCPALREPAYLSGENAGPGSKTSSNEG